jgi:hypothetical protein
VVEVVFAGCVVADTDKRKLHMTIRNNGCAQTRVFENFCEGMTAKEISLQLDGQRCVDGAD